MTLVYCSEAQRGLLEAHVSGYPVIRTEWQQFRKAAPSADCLVVVVDRLDAEGWLERLADLRSAIPHAPLLLVLTQIPSNARLLSRLDFDAVIWFEDLSDFPVRVAALRSRADHRLLIDLVDSAPGISAWLRHRLHVAVQADPPPRSAKSLAGGPNQGGQLKGHWHREIRRRQGGTIKEFLDVLLLVRASAYARRGRQPVDVAAALRISTSTLGRLGQRQGIPVKELGLMPSDELLRRLAAALGVEPHHRRGEPN